MSPVKWRSSAADCHHNVALIVLTFRAWLSILVILALGLVGTGLALAQSSPSAVGPDGQLLTKSVDRTSASSGDTLTYTLRLDYGGDAQLSEVVVTDSIPVGTSYMPGSANAGGVENNGVVTWELGGNAAGVDGHADDHAGFVASTSISLSPTLVAAGDLVTVVMTLTASKDVPGVVPEMLSVSGPNGVGATLVSGPTPASATVGPAGTTFTWTYRAWSSGVDDPLAGLTAYDGPQSQPVPSNIISVGPDHVYKDTDFAFISPSKGLVVLGDTVWYDANGDTLKQDTEPGIPGVMIEARDNGGARFTAITDATGRYLLEVPPGVYSLAVADPPADLTPTTSVTIDAGLLLADETFLDGDFGFADGAGALLGQIGNLVFDDANRNGFFDPGESPLAGVSVDLIRDSDGDGEWDDGEPVIATTTTAYWQEDAQGGNYLFAGLPSGAYLVHVSDTNAVLVDYLHSTLGVAGSDQHNQNDPYAVFLAAGADNFTADFGYYQIGMQASAVGDFVWYDVNRNGLQDVGEPGIGNVVLDLYKDADGSGGLTPADVLVDSTVTDADGGYLFRNLVAGNYIVDVADGVGQLSFVGAAQAQGTIWPEAQSNSAIVTPPLNFAVTVDVPAQVSVVENTAQLSDSSGALPPTASNTVVTTIGARIGDTVWDDRDGDGIRDGDEPGLAGVVVELARSGGEMSTTTTDANGLYAFTALTAGTYTITFDESTVSADFSLITTPYPQRVQLGGAENYTAADIGLKAFATVIGDSIWYDADGDGLQDVGEPGIGNITAVLYFDNDGDGGFNPACDVVVDSTVSDALGAYRLDAPAPGGYFVDVTDDYGILDGMSHSIGAQSISEPSPLLQLAAGDIYRDADFGYVQIPTGDAAIITGKAWLDGDSSTFCDQNEPILIGVQVCATPTAGGAAICEMTDLNGRYLMEAPAGSYVVSPTSAPAGLTPTTPTPLTVTVAAGEQYLSANFGYTGQQQAMGSLGGEIWQDIPIADVVDGVYDHQNEPGIGYVSINLVRDENGDGVWQAGEPILATLSDTDGGYLYEHLLAGEYIVEVSDSYLVLRYFDPTAPGPDPDADDNNHPQPYPAHLGEGEANMSIDFGYREYEAIGSSSANPGLIGDQIWLDVNDDGLFNPESGDQPISGVTVQLSQNSAPIATTTTGADGKYLFTDLLPGSYSVRVTDHFDVLAHYTSARPGPDPGQDGNNQSQPYAVTLGFNPVNMTADFGYRWLDSSYAISKVLNTPNPSRPAEPIDFTISITNTGEGWIAVLPLQDVYDPTYLRFKSATPAPIDGDDDGQLDWSDLTATLGDLAPGASIEIQVHFQGVQDTTHLPGGSTINTTSVQSALADPDGSGPLGAIAPLTDASAAEGVQIFAPTGLRFVRFEASAQPGGVRLRWQTLSEVDIVGFRVLRGMSPVSENPLEHGFIPLAGEIIVAEQAGMDAGAAYSFVDKDALPGVVYWYALAVLKQHGGIEYYGAAGAALGVWQVFTPWVAG